MSQPTWDPDNRRWLFEGEDTPAPRRNRRRSVDVIDRSGTGDGTGVPDTGHRAGGPPSLGAQLTHVGFGAREPRPDDRGRGGPARSDRTAQPADQGFPRSATDDGRDGDGGWSLLDPYRPDPLGSDGPDRDGYSDAPWYGRRPDGRSAVRDDRVEHPAGRPAGDRGRDPRSDVPEAYRPGGFDRTWSSGLAGPGDVDDRRPGAAAPTPSGLPADRNGSAEAPWSEYDRTDRGRRRADGHGHDPHDRNGYGPSPMPEAPAPGRRAAPERPAPLHDGRQDDGRRARPVPAPEPHGRGRYDRDGTPPGPGPDATSRVGTDGRRAPRPGPDDTVRDHAERGWPPPHAADGYGPDEARSGRHPRPDVPRGRGAAGYDDRVEDDRFGAAYDDRRPDAGGWSGEAPQARRHGRHPGGVDAPEGPGPAGHDRDGTALPGYGYAPHDGRDGRDGNGYGRHGPDPRGGPAAVGGAEAAGYVRNGHGPTAHAPAPAAYAPDGPARAGRHGGVPDGFGQEEFDGDGYNLDGLGRDGYDRDGFDLYGFDREGFDRHGFDREGYDRDGYPADADAYEYDEDDYAAEHDGAYGYAAGYGPDGYRPGRRRAYDEQDGYDGYEDAYAPGPEGTLSGGEVPVVGEESDRRSGRASRRGTGDKERRRWPWMVGAAAAAAAVAVPVGMSLLGGSDEGSGARDAPLLSGGAGTAGLGAPGAGQSPAPGAPADAAAQPAGSQVTYEVNGAGKAGSITFGRGTSVAQVQEADLPWKQESPGAQEASDYSVTAVSGDGGGELSCKILVNGAVIAEDSAKGDYAAVSCNGRR